MKVSELIIWLQSQTAQHGDLKCYVADTHEEIYKDGKLGENVEYLEKKFWKGFDTMCEEGVYFG